MPGKNRPWEIRKAIKWKNEITESESKRGGLSWLLVCKTPGCWCLLRLPASGKGLGGQDANALHQGPIYQGHLSAQQFHWLILGQVCSVGAARLAERTAVVMGAVGTGRASLWETEAITGQLLSRIWGGVVGSWQTTLSCPSSETQRWRKSSMVLQDINQSLG